MKKRLSLILLALALVHYGASEPRTTNSGGASGASQKSKSRGAAISPQGFAVDQIMNFFSRKTGKELMDEKKSGNQNASASGGGGGYSHAAGGKVPLAVPVAKLPGSAVEALVKPATKIQAPFKLAAVPPPHKISPAVMAIRKEVQNIFTLNKTINKMSTNQSAQIQSVQGQARIHQKILNELEAAQSQEKGDDQKTPTKSDLLAQEKLRIIHEETQRNTQILDELNGAPDQTGSETNEQPR